jgi:hypothetical protein
VVYVDCGNVLHLRCWTRRVIHLFISSTFDDMRTERNRLVQRILPSIETDVNQMSDGQLLLCPIDLRWGVDSIDRLRFVLMTTSIR